MHTSALTGFPGMVICTMGVEGQKFEGRERRADGVSKTTLLSSTVQST